MSRYVLEQLSDLGDYTGKNELYESFNNSLANVRLSSDGRHVHVILHEPKVGLVTLDKYERPQLVHAQKKLDLCSTRDVSIVDILYLDSNNCADRDFLTVAVVFENGQAEFWKFQDCKGGWSLLQTADLCNSPRAKVVSVCACPNLIIWCEERPPSESSPLLSPARNKLRHCVCRRDFELKEGSVFLGGVKITLHNNPRFNVITSGQYVYLLPDARVKPFSKFFLSWCPRQDSFRVSTTCKGGPLKKHSAKDSDFRKLIKDCLGFLAAANPPEILNVSSSDCGGLLLLLNTGWVCLLHSDGTLRHLHKVADKCLLKSVTHTSLRLYQNTLVLILGQKLHLIDSKCGRVLGKIILNREGVLFALKTDKSPYLFSESGLFKVVRQETDTKDRKTTLPFFTTTDNIDPRAVLLEAVFEEACKYYQQRSLSSTQLTVDALKKEGRFQAPISLAAILNDYLCSKTKQRAAELSSNGESGGDVGEDQLKVSLVPELKALVTLEELKGALVRGGAKEVEVLCENLVEKEVARLLSSSELHRDDLLYLNSIFSVFPCQSWRAAKAALQLRCSGEGSLSSEAPPDVWKSVLGSAPSFPVSLTLSNGGSRRGYSHTADHNGNCTSKSPRSSVALPVFELLCHSVLLFQPAWLPRFLELSQQQQGSAGLGLSLAASSWSLSAGRAGDSGGESNVPLYKRALSVLSTTGKDQERRRALEVEVLMVSGRPNAILQALRILIGQQQWEKVIQVAQKFCKQSPLLNKEIFTTLLCEVTQHRELDPYLDLLWALCPEDITVTTILNMVLKNLPSPLSASSRPGYTTTAPFTDPQSGQVTVGLLKPLLRKVLQRETKPNRCYADILESPSFPPPAPPRLTRDPSKTSADSPQENTILPGSSC
ncbi:BLOC-2 complex member HPS6 [Corythoichthys intestinalis]|uniref:BLOC-2 complex member HPS6 n=1 Tax=Corythoichthys intestinalis TaxID=161448 RepID=UPI0025A542D7|nr:BLOC-2 complex member HPS6 [Corythoichthys intestinalis]XP_057704949.1 BLOC-2 complex member HPS6 [Corythoichthys intestinalis]XP_061793992.1 BLOC-2 complex member HPS6-like [Nerophis lumbriciformis]